MLAAISQLVLERRERWNEEVLATLRHNEIEWQGKIGVLCLGVRAKDITSVVAILTDDGVEAGIDAFERRECLVVGPSC